MWNSENEAGAFAPAESVCVSQLRSNLTAINGKKSNGPEFRRAALE